MSDSVSQDVILVVDDNAAGRYATCRILEAAGFRTLQSAGGAEALQTAKQGVTAVVLDVHLPDVHGFEVCRLLRSSEATAHLPIIHVSAVHIGDDDRVTGLSAGADAYYTAPVEPGVLVATLKGLIRLRETTAGWREREILYRGAFDRAPVGMALMANTGRIADANLALARLLQRPREALLGQALSQWASGADRARVAAIELSWRTRAWEGRLTLLTPSGQQLATYWTCEPHTTAGWSVASCTLTSAERVAQP